MKSSAESFPTKLYISIINMLSSSRSITKCPQIRLHIQCDEFCLTGSFTCFFLALFSFLPKKKIWTTNLAMWMSPCSTILYGYSAIQKCQTIFTHIGGQHVLDFFPQLQFATMIVTVDKLFLPLLCSQYKVSNDSKQDWAMEKLPRHP